MTATPKKKQETLGQTARLAVAEQVLFRFSLVFGQPAEIELHRALVFGLEVALLSSTTTRSLSVRL